MNPTPATIIEPQSMVDAESPWLGLEPYTEATQEFFFGRDEDVRELFLRVRGQTLTVLFGQSGLGKTSLLGAGLMPKLRVTDFRPVLLRFRFTEDDPPLLEQVRKALADACEDDPLVVEEKQELWRHSTLWETLHHVRLRPAELVERPPVLIFDMFEELFTLGQSVEGRSAEVRELFEQLADFIENRPPASVCARLLTNPTLANKFDFDSLSVRLVFALREDYLAALEGWNKTIPSLMRNRMALRSLNGGQALQAVVGPGNLEPGRSLVSDDVGARIVRFVADKPAATPLEEIQAVSPPLLSLTCDGLNRARLEKGLPAITADLVDDQAPNILQNFYEQSFEGCPYALRSYVEDEMITPSGYRNSVERETAEVFLRKHGVPDPGEQLSKLISRRLLSAEERGKLERLELTHDVLAPLAVKSRVERAEREERERIMQQAHAKAARAAAEARILIEQAEREEREASEARACAEKERRVFKRLAMMMGGLVLLLFGALGSVWWYYQQAQRAHERSEVMRVSAEAKSAALKVQLLEAARSDRVAAQDMARHGRIRDAAAYLARSLEYNLSSSPGSDVWVGGAPLMADAPLFDDAGRLSSAETGFYLFIDTELHLPSHILSGWESTKTVATPSPDGSLIVVTAAEGAAWVFDAREGTRKTVLQGHQGLITSAEFSPDNRHIVTGSEDHTARVWDAASGKLLFTLQGHTAAVTAAHFSADGTRLLTCSHDRTARQWDMTGKETGTVIRGHSGALLGASFNPAGDRVLTASEDRTARVWDAASGRQISIMEGHEAPVTAARFSPDGRRVLTLCEGGQVRVWEIDNGWLALTLEGHAGAVRDAEFSPDGQRIVTACDDKLVRVWDANSGKVTSILPGHEGPVRAATFSADGQRVITASEDRTVRIWDPGGAQIAVLQGHHDQVTGARFFASDRLIVTSSADKSVRIWEAGGNRLSSLLRGHKASIKGAQFSPDGLRIVTASGDATAKIWDAGSGALLATLVGHKAPLASAQFSPDGARVVTASVDKTARVWDAGKATLLVTLAGHADGLLSARFSPDGMTVVTGSWDNSARLWDASAGGLLRVFQGHDDWVFNAQFSPDGKSILTVSEDRTARLWRVPGGEPLAVLRGHEASMTGAQFSPDGRLVLTTSYDKSARLWEASSGEMLAALQGHDASVTSAQFSPDGGRVVTASGDNTARIWSTTNGKVLCVLRGHTKSIRDARFSPDGSQIVTASGDGTVRVWDAGNGKALAVFAIGAAAVSSAQFGHDGRLVLAGSEDSVARTWEAPAFSGAPPAWFSDFLRLLAQRTIDSDGELVDIAPAGWVVIRERVRSGATSDATRYGEIARWFLTPAAERPIRPGHPLTQEAVADKFIKPEASEWEIRHAYELAADHPLIHLALARFEADPVIAEFLRHYDLGRLSNASPAALRERARLLLQK